jgi:hypothetical protein
MIPTEVLFSELAYFLAIFFLGLSIYVQTRRLRQFSFHRGVAYFRNAFFSFSLIYLFRLLTLLLDNFAKSFGQEQVMLSQLCMFLVVFFSLFAILSLISSVTWKHFRFITNYRLTILSLLLASVTFFLKLSPILLAVGLVAIGVLVYTIIQRQAKSNKVFSPILVIYTLLIVFFLFDLVPFIQEITPIQVELAGYVGAVAIFVYINLKIKRVFEAGKEEAK